MLIRHFRLGVFEIDDDELLGDSHPRRAAAAREIVERRVRVCPPPTESGPAGESQASG